MGCTSDTTGGRGPICYQVAGEPRKFGRSSFDFQVALLLPVCGMEIHHFGALRNGYSPEVI